MHQLRYSLLLFIAAVIWGLAFVAQQTGMDYLGPLAFNGIRWLVGALTLFVFLFIFYERPLAGCRELLLPSEDEARRTLLTAGLVCGLATAFASNMQQWGILLANSIGKAGFITATYVVLVPLFGIFLGQKVSPRLLVCALFSLVGFFLLSVDEGFSVKPGDLVLLAGAAGYAVQILAIDRFSPKCSSIALAFWEFLVCGLVSTLISIPAEHPGGAAILSAWVPIAYAGVLSCGVAFTLQIVAQSRVNPTVASLIMCLESVVSAIAGALILHQFLSPRQILGCVIVLFCVILIQLPGRSDIKPSCANLD